jgi:hypothetical protein
VDRKRAEPGSAYRRGAVDSGLLTALLRESQAEEVNPVGSQWRSVRARQIGSVLPG